MNKLFLLLLIPFLLQAQLVDEHFESGTIPGDWSITVGADWIIVTDPALEGMYSLQGDTAAATDGVVTISFDAVDELWLFFIIQVNYTGADLLFRVSNGGTSYSSVVVNYVTVPDRFRILEYSGIPYGSYYTGSGSILGILHHYKKGTGANAISQLWEGPLNTDGSWTKPLNPDINGTTGAGTVDINNIKLIQHKAAGPVFNVWDAIIISTTEIGDYSPPNAPDTYYNLGIISRIKTIRTIKKK